MPSTIPPRGIPKEDRMTDPVCGMDVTPQTAAGAWAHGGMTYYFCSVGCLERFRADPERFLALGDAERAM
jgi:Cu+-exporting ATPase